MVHFHFGGRPDGLGNRIEELVWIRIMMHRSGCACTYHWVRAPRADRTYPVQLECEGIRIVQDDHACPKSHIDWTLRVSHDELRLAAQSIRSLHALHFDPPDVLPRVAIHIRAGDKVNHQPGRAEMTVATFQRFYERGVAFCTQYALEPVLVVSDTPSVMQRFVSDAKLQHVVRATSLSQNEYTDFFALAQCETIVLVGVFSTYSIMAFFVGQGKHFIVFDESCKGIRYDDIMEVVTAQ